MSRYLAVDPGGVTGVAIYDDDDPATLWAGQVDGGRFGFYPWFRSWMERTVEHDIQVVCEDFIINSGTATKSRQSDPLRIAGYLEGICSTSSPAVPFHLQTPATAKAFCSDDKLRHLGWYFPTPGGHANDAARHMITHLATTVRSSYVLNKLGEMLS